METPLTLDPFSTDAFAALPARDQRSVIGHASHDLMSPLSDGTVATLIEQIGYLDCLLDVGCGKAAFARRMLGSGRAGSAVCIERNPVLAAYGRRKAEKEGLAIRIRWIVGDVSDWRASDRFDGLAVIGASQALGGLSGALAFAADHLIPGGKLVLGEPVWASPPPAEYLQFLGTDGSETVTPEALATALESAGFRVEHRHRSTPDEWSSYEDPYFATLAAYTTSDGQQPYAAGAHTFANMQAKYGRVSMGFEAVVARSLN